MQLRIRNFVWHGVFATIGVTGAHWVNQDVAALHRADGGLAIPDLKAELYTMAAAESIRWATTSSVTMLMVGDILSAQQAGPRVGPVYLSMGYRSRGCSGHPFPNSVWATGRQMLLVAGDDEALLPDPLLAELFSANAKSNCLAALRTGKMAVS
ncbi:unnamed protein product [Phytophthora fragariaefolia]|uniref:Unnamed protein product n=1 Tax=Phytophthora fragariaefolia TaxID=1490495 RepID=A0A9W7CV06_9STRA|nr:unnamed protein product [Phytophthora fragariaefolia]